MFKKRTLFILGAGASAEVGMPVGRRLVEQIIESGYFHFDFHRLESGDVNLLSILRHRFRDNEELNKRLRVARKISDGIFMASSIDNYIDTHSDDPLVTEFGKLQIAYKLLQAERNSSLYFSADRIDSKMDLPRLSGTWFDAFARILFEKQKRDSFSKLGENVSIITFNYDRCIEFFLIEAIRQLFSVSYGEAYEAVSNIEIIHPYGSLGTLPHLLNGRGVAIVPFGMETEDASSVWESCEKLKTYTEQIEDVIELRRIHAAVEEADQIVFLGFAFHPQNMEILSLPGGSYQKTVYATGFGVSSYEIEEVTKRIVGLYHSDSRNPEARALVSVMQGVTCANLFEQQWRNLSAA